MHWTACILRRVNPARRANRDRAFRLSWGVILFLAGFFILLLVVSNYYLLPAMQIAPQATPTERRWLQAASALLLAVVLFVLIVGLMMVFRVGRFFMPRSLGQRTETKYVDAWAESAKRIEVEPEDDEDDEDDERAA
jgi:hypothetical protein